MNLQSLKIVGYYSSSWGEDYIKRLVDSSTATELVALESRVSNLARHAAGAQPQVMLVEFDSQNPKLLAALDEMHSKARMTIMALSRQADPQDLRRAMQVGVSDYLFGNTAQHDFVEAVDGILRAGLKKNREHGRLIAVTSVKEGLGASSLALNLSWSLAKHQKKQTSLIDMDFANADLSTLLDLENTQNFSQIITNFDALDEVMMKALLHHIGPGLAILPSPGNHLDAEEIQLPHLEQAITHLLSISELVVADVPPGLGEMNLCAWDYASKILLVVDPSIVVLQRAQKTLNMIRRLDPDGRKIIWIVNRADSRGGIGSRSLHKILNSNNIHFLPNDSKALMRAANSGQPLMAQSPRSRWGKRVRKLSKRILESMPSGQKAVVSRSRADKTKQHNGNAKVTFLRKTGSGV